MTIYIVITAKNGCIQDSQVFLDYDKAVNKFARLRRDQGDFDDVAFHERRV